MRTLYRAGAVYSSATPSATTLPTTTPSATALVVDGGTIAWLGSREAATDLVPAVDAVVDLDDCLITPGFVDAHAHLTETGLLLAGLDLRQARSVTDILSLVEGAARRNGGRPILGHGWDEAHLIEGRPPTGAELDRASAGGVVYLSRVDAHSAVISGALAAAYAAATHEGWTDDGRVERDAHHAARDATRGSLSASARRSAQLAALRQAAAAGIVCVHEMSAPHIAPDSDLRELLDLTGDQERALPAVIAYRGELVGSEAEARAVLDRLGVPIAGLAGDLCVDGSVGSRTAYFRRDYADAPGCQGHQYLTVEQIRDHVAACTRIGVQAGFHVIGDAAIEAALRGVRRAAEQVGIAAVRTARHRLEHVEAIDADGIADLADLGLTASVQPAFDAFWGGRDGMYARRLGADRATVMNPLAALVAAGVPVALGSDSPVTPFDPWGAVGACAAHHAQIQRIGAPAAFAAHTRGAWRAAGVDGAGVLTVGAPADFAAWPVTDSVADAIARLPDLTPGVPPPVCLMTVGRGRILHDAR
jgi:predicted amidohydrolase YtcJ